MRGDRQVVIVGGLGFGRPLVLEHEDDCLECAGFPVAHGSRSLLRPARGASAEPQLRGVSAPSPVSFVVSIASNLGTRLTYARLSIKKEHVVDNQDDVPQPSGARSALDALVSMVGTDLPTTDWATIVKIEEDVFASLVEDYDDMHNSGSWADGSGLGSPIIIGTHGLSLLPAALRSAGVPALTTAEVKWRLVRSGKIRFPDPCTVGARFRIHTHLVTVTSNAGRTSVTTNHSAEIEGVDRPWFTVVGLESEFEMNDEVAG